MLPGTTFFIPKCGVSSSLSKANYYVKLIERSFLSYLCYLDISDSFWIHICEYYVLLNGLRRYICVFPLAEFPYRNIIRRGFVFSVLVIKNLGHFPYLICFVVHIFIKIWVLSCLFSKICLFAAEILRCYVPIRVFESWCTPQMVYWLGSHFQGTFFF